MMASPDALLETQALKQLAQIVETDGRVGISAQEPSKRLLSSHNDILHAGPVCMICRDECVRHPMPAIREWEHDRREDGQVALGRPILQDALAGGHWVAHAL